MAQHQTLSQTLALQKEKPKGLRYRGIMLSEIYQTEKDKYHVIFHYMIKKIKIKKYNKFTIISEKIKQLKK